MQFIFLIQARLGSTRRPGKTLTEIANGKTLLESVYTRVMQAKEAQDDNVFVVTSDSPKDDPLVAFMDEHAIKYGRGDEQNVYKRFRDFLTSQELKPDYVIRVCCDNPFLDPQFMDEMTEFLKTSGERPEYLTHADSQGHSSMATHYGFFTEAIRYDAYMRAEELGLTDVEKEHVTPQFYKSGKFTTKFLPMPREIEMYPYRFTIDTEDDLRVVRTVATELPEKFSHRDVIAIVQKYPELMEIMSSVILGDKKEGR